MTLPLVAAGVTSTDNSPVTASALSGLVGVGLRRFYLVGIVTDGNTVSSLDTSARGGTWSQLGTLHAGGVGVDLWMGINTTATGSIIVNHSASSKFGYGVYCFDLWGPTASVPTPSNLTLSGSGTAGATANRTGMTKGDIVVTLIGWNSVIQPSSFVSIPANEPAYSIVTGTLATTRMNMSVRMADNTSDYNRIVNFGSSVNYVALSSRFQLPIAGSPSKLYKGRTTQALDELAAA